ncbi:threonine aldolase [Bacteroides sp. 214]|uniref:threonine aldolase family protein n=1 Tax=Bacteroides sp. 214 TaxID=2302935 RepID=UPI0013D72AE8|nr:beta-eliminating lyase-related protein [Bacteroides sp. 214]NDW13463.1 threonine aldolase [Bacteroides sp. 214]
MRSFASDNNSGVHPLVIDAICAANQDHALGYGSDRWTNEAVAKIKQTFGDNCEPFFVFNGTGSNIVALQLLLRPYNSILCAETSHIFVDECGGPVKSTGCTIRPIQTPDGKLTPELIRPYLTGFGDQHHSQPGVIYLSQCTELGTIYTVDELKAITNLAYDYNIKVVMDGARIANACAAQNLSLRELTVDCGIDALTFGGTKNGLMIGECVIVFDQSLRQEALFVRKQSAQLASKMRYLSCQFTAYLTDELWLKNAQHANSMAGKLYEALNKSSYVCFTQKVESNQLFLTMPRAIIDKLLEFYFFYFWNEANNEIRLVTSFDTTQEDIDVFIKAFYEAVKTYR